MSLGSKTVSTTKVDDAITELQVSTKKHMNRNSFVFYDRETDIIDDDEDGTIAVDERQPLQGKISPLLLDEPFSQFFNLREILLKMFSSFSSPPYDSTVFGRRASFEGYLPYPYVPNFGEDPATIPGLFATVTKKVAVASLPNAKIRLPKVLRLGARDLPKVYANLSLNCVDFLFGAFAGLYIGFQNGYIQEGRMLKINRHIFFHNDSIEVGGKPANWIRWLLGDWYNSIDVGFTALVYAVAGGCTQALMCTLYRSFFSADGSLIPMMGTYFIFSVADNNFFGNYQTFGNLLYITCSYEAFMMVVYKGNSTYWIRHFLERYVLRPFQYAVWPINWTSWRPYLPQI